MSQGIAAIPFAVLGLIAIVGVYGVLFADWGATVAIDLIPIFIIAVFIAMGLAFAAKFS